MVELATEKRLKAIRTDNGGEYTSRKFRNTLRQKEFVTSSRFQRIQSRMG